MCPNSKKDITSTIDRAYDLQISLLIKLLALIIMIHKYYYLFTRSV